MSQRNISEQRLTLGALLRTPYTVLQRRVYGSLAERGFPDIRPAHSSVFRHIAPSGSRVSDMAERAQMTKQSMSYLVEDLAASGYVRMVPHPEDGRAKLVCLTEKGHQVWAVLLDLSAEFEADLARTIGRAEMAKLRALLTKVYYAIS